MKVPSLHRSPQTQWIAVGAALIIGIELMVLAVDGQAVVDNRPLRPGSTQRQPQTEPAAMPFRSAAREKLPHRVASRTAASRTADSRRVSSVAKQPRKKMRVERRKLAAPAVVSVASSRVAPADPQASRSSAKSIRSNKQPPRRSPSFAARDAFPASSAGGVAVHNVARGRQTARKQNDATPRIAMAPDYGLDLAVPTPNKVLPPITETPSHPPAGHPVLTLDDLSLDDMEADVTTSDEMPMPAIASTEEQRRELQIAADRADEHIRKGISVAGRRALFSARNDFIQALRLIAEAHDSNGGQTAHSDALSRGLRALQEADDFVPRGANLEAGIDMSQVVANHRTRILKSDSLSGVDTKSLSPRKALKYYYIYASQQFALASGSMPAGSMALYGLAKIHSTLAEKRPADRGIEEFRAMALHQAALIVDPRNPMSANELGVLLARYGRVEIALELFQRSLEISPQPAVWHNLAKVSAKLNRPDLAEYARRQAAISETNGASSSQVRWLNRRAFGQVSMPSIANAVPATQYESSSPY